MTPAEVNQGLFGLLPSFSTVQPGLLEASESEGGEFSSLLSGLTEVAIEGDEDSQGGALLPLQVQALPQNTPQATLQPRLDVKPDVLLDRIRKSQQLTEDGLNVVAPADASPVAAIAADNLAVPVPLAAVVKEVPDNAVRDAAVASQQPMTKDLQKAILQPQQEAETELTVADGEEQLAEEIPAAGQVTQIKAGMAQSANPVSSSQPASAEPSPVAVVSEQEVEITPLRSETFSNSDDSIITDAELEKLEEGEQVSSARERMDFGRDKENWTPAMGSRIVTMVAQDIQQAQIHLDPPELGSMEIKLQVTQEQATVQVQVQNPQVRDVLESNAQRLREALEEQGLELAGFDVSEQSHQDASGQQQNSDAEQGGESGNSDSFAAEQPESVAAESSGNGLLDAYA